MSRRRPCSRFRIASVLLALNTAAVVCGADAEPPSERILRAVRDLGAPQFHERQQSTEFLWSAGEASRAALEKAVAGTDPEVRLRARAILDRFQYGVYADTPQQTIALIQRFRGGDTGTRRDVMRTLVERSDLKTILSLAASEPNPDLQREWNAHIDDTLMSLVPALLADQRKEEAEQRLNLAASTDDGMRHRATYLLLTGRLSAEVLGMTSRNELSLTERKWLAFAYRALGEEDRAREWAKSVSPAFLVDVLYEQHDWAALAKLQDAVVAHRNTDQDAESLGYAAAYHRLSGDDQAFGEVVRTIKQLPERKEGQAWYAAEALLVNGEIDEAVALLREDSAAAAFEILCALQRYRDAFALAEIPYPDGLSTNWFRSLAKDAADIHQDVEERFRIGICAAKAIHTMGYREVAAPGLSLLAEGVMNDRDGRRLRQVCEAEVKLDLWDRAIQHGAWSLAKDSQPHVLSVLFPEDANVAGLWWDFLRTHRPDRSLEDRLRELSALLSPQREQASGEGPRVLLEMAAQEAMTAPRDLRQAWLEALGRTWLKCGNRSEARKYYEMAGHTSAACALQVGDLLAADAQWSAAAEWYERAWQMQPQKPLAMYLRGQSLIRSGRQAEGESLIATAKLLPLASRSRHDLAVGMSERGDTSEAAEQWELILRTAAFRQWHWFDAAKRLGNAISTRDELAASQYWEAMLLSCLSTRMAFMEIQGYVQIPLVIHKTRAIGLLKARRIPEAMSAIRLSRRYGPADPGLAEDLVPALEQAGRPQDAQELFDNIYAQLRGLCEEFPHNSLHRNSIAWMSARCNRELDAALKYALQAVELRPDCASYLDTLAEVQFRRGDAAEAVRLAERCLLLDPVSPHFQQQRARFSAAANPSPGT